MKRTFCIARKIKLIEMLNNAMQSLDDIINHKNTSHKIIECCISTFSLLDFMLTWSATVTMLMLKCRIHDFLQVLVFPHIWHIHCAFGAFLQNWIYINHLVGNLSLFH